MSELFTVHTPPDAWQRFLQHFQPSLRTERIATADALDRVLAEPLVSPQDLPDFERSTVDGYAVNAADTYGASSTLPAFLALVGEVPMGQASALTFGQRENAPIFLPYLSGERTPHNNAAVRGSFHGLSHDTHAATLAYAVIEGVTFGLCDGLRALQAAGCEVHRLSLVGGGARSAMWAQQLASALNIEIVTHTGSASGGALGAARLAWLAYLTKEAGLRTPSETSIQSAQAIHSLQSLQGVCVAPAIDHVFTPDAAEQALLAPRYAQFRALYAA